MKKVKQIIGVDVSKLTLDIHFHHKNQHLKIENNFTGFKLLLKEIKCMKLLNTELFVVLEFTGGYEYRFIQFLSLYSIDYVRMPGLAIKRSMGIIRGKSDSADAKRIAQFGYEKKENLVADKPLNKNILALKELLAFRKEMVIRTASAKNRLNERAYNKLELAQTKIVARICKDEITFLQKQIEKVEAEIINIINSDQDLKRNYEILISIKGVGPVNAMMTIAYTENFTAFNTARQYASYVGVAPFEHSSGTSIKGKTRTSKLRRSDVKSVLTMAARSAKHWNKDLAIYAQRISQNKHKGIVINNVAFKLVCLMFSLVKRNELYVENYKNAA